VRKILHVDMDAFYASVEQRDQPELRGKPVIVGWNRDTRGVVVAASYEVRPFGVRSAMPMSRALRLCPDAIVVRPDFERYRAVSSKIREIFLRHTPLVEPLSLDEAYLDVSEELTGIPTATETARVIRREIREETGLTASAGVAPNKFLAKIASDWKKPDGLFVIKPHQVDRFLLPLPVGKIPGVGKATERALAQMLVRTVGELRSRELHELVARFGKFGERLFGLARGIDDRPVVASRERKSFSAENTFSTDLSLSEVAVELAAMATRLWEELAKKKLSGRTVTVKLRSADFTTATRRLTPPLPPASAGELESIALALLERFDFPKESRYRLVGVGLSNFVGDDEGRDNVQASLFDLVKSR